MRILLLDLDRMLGHVIKPCLENFGHEVVTISNDTSSPNFYDPEHNVYRIEDIIANVKPDAVVNCLATLIEESETNHKKAVLVNSFLPNYLDELSTKYHFKFIHRSTDCIFEGTAGNYTETSIPDATNFYGRTKALGEINNDHTLTLRVSIIGPDQNPNGESLFPWFLRQTGEISGYSEVYWTGITTVEFARIIDLGLKNNLSGIYNISNGIKIKKSDLLRLFAKYYPLEGLSIIDNPTKKSDKSLFKSPKFDFNIPNYDTMISNMYDWTKSHPDFYPHLQERK